VCGEVSGLIRHLPIWGIYIRLGIYSMRMPREALVFMKYVHA